MAVIVTALTRPALGDNVTVDPFVKTPVPPIPNIILMSSVGRTLSTFPFSSAVSVPYVVTGAMLNLPSLSFFIFL